MTTAAVLACADAIAAIALLASVPRQKENKASVLVVAAVLLGVAGWLGVIAWSTGGRPTQQPAPASGRTV